MRITNPHILPKAKEEGVNHRYDLGIQMKAGDGKPRLLSRGPWDRLLHAVAGLSVGNGLPRLM
jgi:hypothetical protein